VWWDPELLDGGGQHDIGFRQEEILRADTNPPASTKSIEDHERWQRRRRDALASGAVPSLRVEAVTAAVRATGEEPGGGAEHETVVIDDGDERPHGKRFGTLVHATLAAVDLAAAEGDVEEAAAAQGRIVGATAEEVCAAARAVTAALGHPLLRRAREAAERGALRRETPLVLRREDGTLLEGVVDLAFRESTPEGGERWTVVELKTDRELGRRRADYERQVQLYARAVAKATGEQARGVLLVVSHVLASHG
jgi:ATP-dependent exoDNAse (exonuclease V) beta subunit